MFLLPFPSLLILVPCSLFCSGRFHFEYFARWSGQTYVPLDAVGADDVEVPIPEFINALRGAVNSLSDLRGIGLPRNPATDPLDPGTNGNVRTYRDPVPARPGQGKTQEETDEPVSNTNADDNNRDPNNYDRTKVRTTKPYGTKDGHRLVIIVPFRDSPSKTSQVPTSSSSLCSCLRFCLSHLPPSLLAPSFRERTAQRIWSSSSPT
jgi:hypothetical protein